LESATIAPEAIDDVQLKELRTATVELKIEFNKPQPSIPTVKKWARRSGTLLRLQERRSASAFYRASAIRSANTLATRS
jgi:hypothetical protein